MFSLMSGAHRVIAVDRNSECLDEVHTKCLDYEQIGRLTLVEGNAEDLDTALALMFRKQGIVPNMFYCFSVLPYLKNKESFLQYLASKDAVSFIEMQYAGDGPGPKDIEDDGDMFDLLGECGFNKFRKIGSTPVVGRNISRSIWKCNNQIQG